jgi:hypothetical protein
MMGILLPQSADQAATALDIGLVPHGNVVLDEAWQVAHAPNMLPAGRPVDNLRDNQCRRGGEA